MDEEQEYKLIKCVDPRKINVPIRDRFAKLTLSNKKKHQETPPAVLQPEENDSVKQLKRVSRNLLEALDGVNANKPVASTSSSDTQNYINPLLRSSSESTLGTQNGNIIDNRDETRNSSFDDYQRYDSIQPLQVSEINGQRESNDDLIDDEISTLTRRVSIMAVTGKDFNAKMAQETTVLVSTESQRMSYDFNTQRLQTLHLKPSNADNIEQENCSEDEREHFTQHACISLTSTSTDDSSSSAITVTDSTTSEFMDFDVMTSTIPQSGQTNDVFLPNTFSNERADRMEAFLRDVSQQRREIEEQKLLEIGEDDFTLLSEKHDKSAIDCTEKGNEYKPLEGQELAYADTETMTNLSYDMQQRKSIEDYDTMKGAGNDSPQNNFEFNVNANTEKNRDTLSLSMRNSENLSHNSRPSQLKENLLSEDSQRLAHDETDVNTLSLSEYASQRWTAADDKQNINSKAANNNYSIICSEQSLANVSIQQPDVPEESVVISETSSENSMEVSGNDSNNHINSTEDVVPSDGSSAVDAESSHMKISPQRQMGIGSINISAKINIKIAISQVDSLEDDYTERESEEEPRKSADVSCTSSGEGTDRSSAPVIISPVSENHNLEVTCDEQRQERSKINNSKAVENNKNENVNNGAEPNDVSEDEGEEEDINFLTQAERLLNQLYGTSWKTPEVIRTLKRTSRTPKKKCTPSTTISKTSTTSSFNEAQPVKNAKQMAEPASGEKTINERVEQSVLDDFSIFRRDIVCTNLDSTRFATPEAATHARALTVEQPTNTQSEPRHMAQKNKQKFKDFKVPKTEVKRKLPTTNQRQCRNISASAERWRKIVDPDEDSATSGDNASDDDTLDKTEESSHDNSTDGDKENKVGADEEEWRHMYNQSDDNASELPCPNKGIREQNKTKQQLFKSPNKAKATRTKKAGGRQGKKAAKNKGDLIYLDLSKDEVTIHEGGLTSPLANNDAKFNNHLESILRTCKATDKAKLPATPNTGGKSKRKLFTANFGEEDVDLTVVEDGVQPRTPRTPVKQAPTKVEEEMLLHEMENVNLNEVGTNGFAIFNKHLEYIKRGDPIFKVTPPRTPTAPKLIEIPKPSKTLRKRTKLTDQLCNTPKLKYGFLKSLDVCVSKTLCHPDALLYRENYRTKKEELAKLLYELYNERLFENNLNVPLQWNKKLCNTAGRCLNKKKLGVRTSVIELSEKVLTSADRLRCTLIHELCHAATWIFSGEGGHGSTWKQWAMKANSVFPEIPKIGVCHQYDIEYKYTYKCTLCAAKSYAHSKSKKVENIRCAFCHGAIEIFLNKKDKDGNIAPTPVREPTGFAKFVKDNYKQYKRPDLKHADVMKILSAEFAALKVQTD